MFSLDQTHGSLSPEDCATLYTTEFTLTPFNSQNRTQEISLTDGKKVGLSFVVSLPDWERRLSHVSAYSSIRDPNQLRLTATDIPTLREHMPLAVQSDNRVILIDSIGEDSITYRDSFDQQVHTISLDDFLRKDIMMTRIFSLSFTSSVPTQ